MTRPSLKGRRDGPAECLAPDGNETRDQQVIDEILYRLLSLRISFCFRAFSERKRQLEKPRTARTGPRYTCSPPGSGGG